MAVHHHLLSENTFLFAQRKRIGFSRWSYTQSPFEHFGYLFLSGNGIRSIQFTILFGNDIILFLGAFLFVFRSLDTIYFTVEYLACLPFKSLRSLKRGRVTGIHDWVVTVVPIVSRIILLHLVLTVPYYNDKLI